jgi:hypothetical protein
MENNACRPDYKPGFVPPLEGAATVIYLGRRLLVGSSDLPEGRSGPDQSCPLIWSCSRWGLPSRPVTRPLVRSYIKATSARTISPLPDPRPGGRRPSAVCFLLHFPGPSAGPRSSSGLGRWALPTTASCGARTFLCRIGDRVNPAPCPATTVRPACTLTTIIETAAVRRGSRADLVCA